MITHLIFFDKAPLHISRICKQLLTWSQIRQAFAIFIFAYQSMYCKFYERF